MGTGWQFENVEHIFREHAKSRGVNYDPDKPLAALDRGAIGRASKLLGAKSWGDFAAMAHVSVSTAKHWTNEQRRATAADAIFPALCDVAATPYKANREAYENGSEWLPQYIEESVAYALIGGTETPEDAESRLRAAWERHSVATLLLAAFTLTGNELETVANVARGALAVSGASVRGQRPYTSGDPSKDAGIAELIESEAEAMEREAVNRVPVWSVASVDFARLKQLTEERAACES